MIQMFPWGWQTGSSWIERECMFSHQAEAVSAWYFNWVNTDRLKGLQPMCVHHLSALHIAICSTAEQQACVFNTYEACPAMSMEPLVDAMLYGHV